MSKSNKNGNDEDDDDEEEEEKVSGKSFSAKKLIK